MRPSRSVREDEQHVGDNDQSRQYGSVYTRPCRSTVRYKDMKLDGEYHAVEEKIERNDR